MMSLARPTYGPTVRGLLWVSKQVELVRKADLPLKEFATALQADASLQPCELRSK